MVSTNNISEIANNDSEIVPQALKQALLNIDNLSESNFNQSCLVARNTGKRLCFLLVENGLVSDSNMTKIQADVFVQEIVDEKSFPIVPIDNEFLSTQFLSENLVLPLCERKESLSIAMVDASDQFVIDSLAMLTNKNIEVKIATRKSIENTLEKLYGDGNTRIADMVEEIETVDTQDDYGSIEHLKDLAGEAPIIRLVNFIITRAVEERASDIHIEPFEHQLKVRYRIDGVLNETEAPPVRSTAAVISRIKIMGKMNIAETRLPQDGRIQIRAHGKLIDLRVSTVPTMHGESVVLRILDKERVEFDLTSMGFSELIEQRFNELLNLPHGIILVTGPTGSGKTTTLYAALQQLNSPDKKILTVEDPVEYQLEGVNQIQVKPKIGLHFADALRSIVRQDPDIIMIGEMRDLETASIAVQSALTGHLVLSTLHTNDAGSSVTRLLDMGVEDYLLTSTLNGVLAQRLVRKLCNTCCSYENADENFLAEFELKQTPDTQLKRYQAKGCDACSNTGYLGRIVISELLTVDEPFRRLIMNNADASQLQNYACNNGMISMYDDGINKSLSGLTTIEEILRVTQEA